MGTYRPLYSLRVEHDYYDNLACRALAFRLKAGGVDLCRRRGLLFRQTAVNEWTLLYDCDSAGVDTSVNDCRNIIYRFNHHHSHPKYLSGIQELMMGDYF